jgi:hypothetical protein
MNRRVKLYFCGSRKEGRKAQQQLDLCCKKKLWVFTGNFVKYKPTLHLVRAGWVAEIGLWSEPVLHLWKNIREIRNNSGNMQKF